MSSNPKNRYSRRWEVSKHSNLVTQQRRLRHITCIIGRNIDQTLVPTTRQTAKCSLLRLYFTIHATDNLSIVLYKSETIDNTLNPNWREFDSKVFSEHPAYKKASSVVVCVWAARKTNDFKVIIRYTVQFSGLVYFKEQLCSYDQSYESNCLLFRMFGGYYTAPPTKLLVDPLTTSEYPMLEKLLKVHEYQVRLSYKKSSLLRAHYTMKAIHETRQQVIHVKNQMDEYLKQIKTKIIKSSQHEALLFRNNLLQQELKLLRENLAIEEKTLQSKQEALLNRENELNRRHKGLEQYVSKMKVCHSAHIGRREMLVKVSAQLSFRRRQLAAELSYVYPIIELPFKEGGKCDFTISGVKLPNSEEFLGEDETMLAVALGNVGHLVYMIAKFSELPLRYPIRPMGSRSSVVDLVTDKLTDKQREFPLYSKGKERFQFHYGVFLLNKNIAQVRYHNGLGTADLRNTLTNLKHLLEAKYGVRVVVKPSLFQPGLNKSELINRTSSLPPTSSPVNQNFLKYTADETDNLLINGRPQSEVLTSSTSGLPSVHVKSQQHRFIARKSVNRKLCNSKSLPEMKENISPNLIEVPFEDLVRSMDNSISPNQTKTFMSTIDESVMNESNVLSGINSGGIDCAEDCLKDHEESYVTVDPVARCVSDSMNRQFSDTLIIPDPFEHEQDEAATENISGLLV